ncbi:unnamed protein product [Linum trigynum]|uniref:Uncharacterized protein n=1 Tax=Linum trigynum TaxID=586398 RepID=A0AAV2FWJ9_9ROSI
MNGTPVRFSNREVELTCYFLLWLNFTAAFNYQLPPSPSPSFRPINVLPRSTTTANGADLSFSKPPSRAAVVAASKS